MWWFLGGACRGSESFNLVVVASTNYVEYGWNLSQKIAMGTCHGSRHRSVALGDFSEIIKFFMASFQKQKVTTCSKSKISKRLSLSMLVTSSSVTPNACNFFA